MGVGVKGDRLQGLRRRQVSAFFCRARAKLVQRLFDGVRRLVHPTACPFQVVVQLDLGVEQGSARVFEKLAARLWRPGIRLIRLCHEAISNCPMRQFLRWVGIKVGIKRAPAPGR